MEEEKKIPSVMLTGDRPTGKLHIGHYVGSLRERVALQNEGAFDEMYIMIADTQALTDNAGNIQKVRDNVIEVALDYLAAGIDPTKVTLFVQSRVPELFELTCYFMDLVTYSRLVRNPTVKSELAVREFGESIPVGFLTYPISQAAEIAHKFNATYKEVFPEPKILLPRNAVCRRLPGTDGKLKMSKSVGNCIYLSDDAKTVEKKVMSMFTDPTHLRPEDPGHTEGNPVFQYLEAFAREEHFQKYDTGFASLAEMEDKYRAGGLGDVAVKKFLAFVLNDTLEPMRVKRRDYESRIADVYAILEEGSRKAEEKARSIVLRARRAMGIDYFENRKFIEKQQKAFKRAHEQADAYAAYLAKQGK